MSSTTAAKRKMKKRGSSNNVSSKWNRMFDRLERYYRERGHSFVTLEDGGDVDVELYRWTLLQRRNYRHQADDDRGGSEQEENNRNNESTKKRRPRLSPARLDLLRAVEFPWDAQSARWRQRYEQLVRFSARYGHTRVPNNSGEYPGLGFWVRNQRREYKRSCQGRPSTLTPERLRALRNIDFEWYKAHDDAWTARYEQLREFAQRHGHPHVPEQYGDNPQLGLWCMNQRTLYRTKAPSLTPERIRMLEGIGFSWSYRESTWNAMVRRLRRYRDEHGHVDIDTADADNRNLRLWLTRQRYFFNRRRRAAAAANATTAATSAGFGGASAGAYKPPASTTLTAFMNDRQAFLTAEVSKGGGGVPQFSSSRRMTEERVRVIEEAVPNFKWKRRGVSGPSSEDWARLFDAMRAKGIQPGMRAKQHWFEGAIPAFAEQHSAKHIWTEEELLELWNQEDNDEDDGYV